MNENESSASLHQEEVDALDVHAQGCETTALLGCSLCIIWLNRRSVKARTGPRCAKATHRRIEGQVMTRDTNASPERCTNCGEPRDMAHHTASGQCLAACGGRSPELTSPEVNQDEIARLLDALDGITTLPWEVLSGVPPFGRPDEVFVGHNDVALTDARGAMDNPLDAIAIAAVMNAAPRLLSTLTAERERTRLLEEKLVKVERERDSLRDSELLSNRSYTISGLIAANEQIAARLTASESQVRLLRETLSKIADGWRENKAHGRHWHPLSADAACQIARAALADKEKDNG